MSPHDSLDAVHVSVEVGTGCPSCSAPNPSGLSLAAFVSLLNGKCVGCTGFTCPGQCVDLTCLWAHNLGKQAPCGCCGAPDCCDAVCWGGASRDGWTWIENTATNKPSPGDLVVFRQPNANSPCHGGCNQGIGPSGHVSVAISATLTNIVSFDQNWGGQFCHEVNHDYCCVWGWQHPTSPPPPPPPPPPCAPGCPACHTCIGGVCEPDCLPGWTCFEQGCIKVGATGGTSAGPLVFALFVLGGGGVATWLLRDRLIGDSVVGVGTMREPSRRNGNERSRESAPLEPVVLRKVLTKREIRRQHLGEELRRELVQRREPAETR